MCRGLVGGVECDDEGSRPGLNALLWPFAVRGFFVIIGEVAFVHDTLNCLRLTMPSGPSITDK